MRPVVRLGAVVHSALLTPFPTDAQWGKVPTFTEAAPAQAPQRPVRWGLQLVRQLGAICNEGRGGDPE
jgi:hypothetical protein